MLFAHAKNHELMHSELKCKKRFLIEEKAWINDDNDDKQKLCFLLSILKYLFEERGWIPPQPATAVKRNARLETCKDKIINKVILCLVNIFQDLN